MLQNAQLLAALSALALAACGGLAADTPDAGSAGSEPLVYDDAGVPERVDPGPDAGVEVCYPIDPVPSSDLPRCEAATRDCVAACPTDNTGDACRQACWGNDPTPASAANVNCSACVFLQLLSCLDDNGCHEAVADHFCCVVAACQEQNGAPGCDQSCDSTPMFTCGIQAAPQCFDLTGGAIGACYAAADAGDADAGPVDGGT